MYLRQSTAQAIKFGPFMDATDAVTPETGLTIAQTSRLLSKAGGVFAQSSTTGNSTHDTGGWYGTTLSATDTNTLGELLMSVQISGAGPVFHRWHVVPADTFDAWLASGAAALTLPSQGAAPATASIPLMLRWLYKLSIVKWDMTGNENRVYNAAGTVVDHKQTVSQSGSVTTKGPLISGP